jgi:hypothetical protein
MNTTDGQTCEVEATLNLQYWNDVWLTDIPGGGGDATSVKMKIVEFKQHGGGVSFMSDGDN